MEKSLMKKKNARDVSPVYTFIKPRTPLREVFMLAYVAFAQVSVFCMYLLLYSIIASGVLFYYQARKYRCFMVEIMRRYDSVVCEGMLKCYNNVVFFKCILLDNRIKQQQYTVIFILVRST